MQSSNYGTGYLIHASKYGSFVKKNGRSNNSSDYNHNYYLQNKQKWGGAPHGRPVGEAKGEAKVFKRGAAWSGNYTKNGYDFYDMNFTNPDYYRSPDDPENIWNKAGYTKVDSLSDFTNYANDAKNVYMYDDQYSTYYVCTNRKEVTSQVKDYHFKSLDGHALISYQVPLPNSQEGKFLIENKLKNELTPKRDVKIQKPTIKDRFRARVRKKIKKAKKKLANGELYD